MGSYIRITNGEGKTWILPKKNMGSAFEIYQPVTTNGKILKYALPIAAKLGFVPIVHNEVEIEDIVPKAILEKIRQCFSDIPYQLSYFGGSPGTHMKPTIQIFSGRRILGYVKYTDNPDIKKLFDNEEIILNYLQEKEVKSVPACLFNDKVDGYYIFVQNTQKKLHAKIVHKMSDVYRTFAQDIFQKTKCLISYDKTDFFVMLEDLKCRLFNLSEEDQIMVTKAIDKVNNYYHSKEKVEFCVCHRDFTPWNTCMVNESLYVFDWEYARKTYPSGIDLARLYVELKRREERKTNQEIIADYKQEHKSILLLMCYLLDNIDIYLNRGKDDDMKIVSLSLDLLRML